MEPSGTAAFDPIRFCIFTTIALIAWVLGPPVAVMLMSGLGLWAYGRAIRQGLGRTKCVLRDPRLVLVYLGIAFLAAAAVMVHRIVQRFG
jgi:hypothetical protein